MLTPSPLRASPLRFGVPQHTKFSARGKLPWRRLRLAAFGHQRLRFAPASSRGAPFPRAPLRAGPQFPALRPPASLRSPPSLRFGLRGERLSACGLRFFRLRAPPITGSWLLLKSSPLRRCVKAGGADRAGRGLLLSPLTLEESPATASPAPPLGRQKPQGSFPFVSQILSPVALRLLPVSPFRCAAARPLSRPSPVLGGCSAFPVTAVARVSAENRSANAPLSARSRDRLFGKPSLRDRLTGKKQAPTSQKNIKMHKTTYRPFLPFVKN